LAFATLSAAAQGTFRVWNPTIPFDFADQYYKVNGIIPDEIMNRRNGTDGLSVFDKAPYEMYSNVRVCATVPAYDQSGNMMFWYPAGDLGLNSFTPDKTGKYARENANQFPIYIFPDPRREGFSMFTGHRHAPIIDLSKQMTAGATQRLGIRVVYTVYFTEKSRSKDAWKLMQYMGDKNGWGADDTPILKSVDDMVYMRNQGYVVVTRLASNDGPDVSGPYTVAPVFENPTGGAIYPDAMLFMTMKDGHPLEAEMMFDQQFQCLQKYGNFCEKARPSF
jgi:hypothetical protein